MRTIGRGVVWAAPAVLATAASAPADSPAELGERIQGATVQPDGSAIRTPYGATYPPPPTTR